MNQADIQLLADQLQNVLETAARTGTVTRSGSTVTVQPVNQKAVVFEAIASNKLVQRTL